MTTLNIAIRSTEHGDIPTAADLVRIIAACRELRWRFDGVEAVGAGAMAVHGAADNGYDHDVESLLVLLAGVDQLIEGYLVGSDASTMVATIRFVDGVSIDVETSDPAILDTLTENDAFIAARIYGDEW